jgi:hypothetical protein
MMVHRPSGDRLLILRLSTECQLDEVADHYRDCEPVSVPVDSETLKRRLRI